MPVYPDNSHSGREKSPEKQIKKVVTGTAKTRKKSDARKLIGFLVPEDVENVRSYILEDVIVPGIKNAIADVVSIVLFNEPGRLGGKNGRSKIAYPWRQEQRDNRREYGRPRTATGFEYDDIIFEIRGDADLVLDQLEEVIQQHGVATVADLYDLSGVGYRNYMANRYGWTDIHTAKVIRLRGDGYTLQLPRAVQID